MLFKQHVGRTKLSDDNTLIRYRKHLFTFIKDRLAETDHVYNTFDTIVTVATDINKWHWEWMAEKAREAGRSAFSTSSKPSGSHQASPFQHFADPDTMDISASISGSGNGKTREDWRKALYGECYSCGSDEHMIAKGCPSKRAICQWYKKAGHSSAVCMTRYLS